MSGDPTHRERSQTLERVSDGVVAFDPEFRYTYLNETAERLLEVDAADALGERVWDVFPEAVGTVAERELRAAMAGQRRASFERYSGAVDRWFEVRAYPDDDGLSVLFVDVTERKRRDRALRERTRQLDALLSHTDDPIYLKDREGRYELMNDAAAGLFGLDADEAVGRTDAELFDAESVAAIEGVDERILSRGERVSETAARTIDGERHVFEDTKFPYRDDDGGIVGVMGISRDVTGQRRHERQLRQAETLFENAQDALFLIDVGDAFRIERVNPVYERLTGLTNEGLAGSTLTEAFGDDDAAAIAERYARCVDDREPLQYEECLSVPEPESYWETSIAPVVVDDEVVQIVGATRNVTERREREQELRETRNTFEAIVRSSPDAIVMLDEQFRVQLWNEAATELFGWTEREILGERAPLVPGEKQTESGAFTAALDRGEVRRSVETVRRTKDGDRIDVSLSSARVTVDGDVVGYMAVFEDIGRRLTYERRLERQRDDLELLTEMLSHDVRNDLQAVDGYADLLAAHVDGDARTYVEKIRQRARDGVGLTRSTGELADTMRQRDPDPVPVALEPILRAELAAAGTTYDADVTVEGRLPSVSVLADDMLDSVFRNLIENAIRHSDRSTPSATVSVSTDPETVSVAVADDGPGIPDDRKGRIFGRGEKGLDSDGTGIGLYLVETLVDRYGGAVRVEDNDPRGVVFTVELDRADAD